MIYVRIGEGPDAPVLTLTGRVASVLAELHKAGNQGCTLSNTAAPRWSDYLCKLRNLGVVIETVSELHSVNDRHARCVLRTPVEFLRVIDLPKNLTERAKEEMDRWFKTLSYKDRGKLKMHRSDWGSQGGNVISLGLRRGKTARRNKKLKREREARFKADQAAYEARSADQARIVN